MLLLTTMFLGLILNEVNGSCRKLMTEVAKEAGNARTKQEKYTAALDMYCLAIRLDPDNLSALNNRALIHLMVNPCSPACRGWWQSLLCKLQCCRPQGG